MHDRSPHIAPHVARRNEPNHHWIGLRVERSERVLEAGQKPQRFAAR